MSGRKYLLIPVLTRYAITAPRDQRRAWDRYWSSVRRTGADGEVLWDAEQPAERDGVLARFRAHADRSLAAVDLGCGNGRQARALTEVAPRVVGVDRAAAAVERARAEVGEDPTLEFRVADITDPAFGPALHAELGGRQCARRAACCTSSTGTGVRPWSQALTGISDFESALATASNKLHQIAP